MADTMLAVVKPEAKPGGEIREVKVPGFGRTDVLVKVNVASICVTDVRSGSPDLRARVQASNKPPERFGC